MDFEKKLKTRVAEARVASEKEDRPPKEYEKLKAILIEKIKQDLLEGGITVYNTGDCLIRGSIIPVIYSGCAVNAPRKLIFPLAKEINYYFKDVQEIKHFLTEIVKELPDGVSYSDYWIWKPTDLKREPAMGDCVEEIQFSYRTYD